MPDAFVLSGRYDVKGEEETVRVDIRKNKEVQQPFELQDMGSNLPALAERIVRQAADWTGKQKAN